MDLGTLRSLSSKQAAQLRAGLFEAGHDGSHEVSEGKPGRKHGTEHVISYRKREIVLESGRKLQIEVIDQHTALIQTEGHSYQALWNETGSAARAFFRLGEVHECLSPIAQVLKPHVNATDLEVLSRMAADGLMDPKSVHELSAQERADLGIKHGRFADADYQVQWVSASSTERRLVLWIHDRAYAFELNPHLPKPHDSGARLELRPEGWEWHELSKEGPYDSKEHGTIVKVSRSPDGVSAFVWLELDGKRERGLLDLRSGKTFSFGNVFPGHYFSSDSQTLFLSYSDRFEAWDVKSKRKVYSLDRLDSITRDRRFAIVKPLSESSSGASSPPPPVPRVIDLRTGLDALPLEGSSARLESATFSVDGRYCLAKDVTGVSRLWDLDKKTSRIVAGVGSREVKNFSVSSDFSRIYIQDFTHNVAVLNLKSGKEIFGLNLGEFGLTELGVDSLGSPIHRVVKFPIQYSKAPIEILDLDTGKNIAQSDPSPRMIVKTVGAIEGHPFWVVLYVNGESGLWDLRSGKEMVHTHNRSFIDSPSVSPDGRSATTVDKEDGTLVLWDLPTGQKLRSIRDETNPIERAIFSSDGRSVISMHADGTATFRDLRDFEVSYQIAGKGSPILSSAFGATGPGSIVIYRSGESAGIFAEPERHPITRSTQSSPQSGGLGPLPSQWTGFRRAHTPVTESQLKQVIDPSRGPSHPEVDAEAHKEVEHTLGPKSWRR